MEEGGTWPYPARGFMGAGSVLGRPVQCLTPEVQVLCRTGYDLDEGATATISAALRESIFGVGVPP